VLRATRALSRHASGFPGNVRRRDSRVPEPAGSSARGRTRDQATTRDGASAAAEPLDPGLPVTQVSVNEEEPPALLDSADRAREVTRAIEQA
jgi:hypothetical protein